MIHIVDDVNNGKIVNELFNQWNSIKTEDEHIKWSEKVAATKFGTYSNITILQLMEKMECRFPSQIIKRDFINEVTDAYESKESKNILK